MMRKTFAAVALAAGLGLAGCGGGDEEPLSNAEFDKRANAICEKGNAEVNKIAEELFGDGKTPSEDEQVSFVEDTVLPNLQQQIDSIGKLEPPEADAEAVDELLASVQGVIDDGEEDIEALAAATEDPFAEANDQAAELGLDQCS